MQRCWTMTRMMSAVLFLQFWDCHIVTSFAWVLHHAAIPGFVPVACKGMKGPLVHAVGNASSAEGKKATLHLYLCSGIHPLLGHEPVLPGGPSRRK